MSHTKMTPDPPYRLKWLVCHTQTQIPVNYQKEHITLTIKRPPFTGVVKLMEWGWVFCNFQKKNIHVFGSYMQPASAE